MDQKHSNAEEEDDEEDFSFILTNPEGALFDPPVYPLFDQSLLYADGGESDAGLSKPPPRLPLGELLTVEEQDQSEPAGPHWKLSGREVVPAPPEAHEKSNFMGFFTLLRSRDLNKQRSKSAFRSTSMFLKYASKSVEVGNDHKVKQGSGGKSKTATYTRAEKTARNTRRFGRTGSWGLHPCQCEQVGTQGQERSFLHTLG